MLWIKLAGSTPIIVNTVLIQILTLEAKSDERFNCWIACVKPFEGSCLDCLSNESLSLLPQKKTPLKCVVRVSSLSLLICLTLLCDRVIQHLRSEQLTLAKCRQNFQSYVRKIGTCIHILFVICIDAYIVIQ